MKPLLSDTIAGTIAVLIPAYNEENTVAEVVRVARDAAIGPVWVVSDGSSDKTASHARDAGANVIEYPDNKGKGGAVSTGAQQIEAQTLVLIDADLVNLKPQHLHRLLEPVQSGRADTTVGLFAGGGAFTDFGNRATPHWSGQRCIPRQTILRTPKLAERGYGIELALTDQIKRDGLRLEYVDLDGVSQVMKEEKIGLLAGFGRRLRMYWQILSYAVRGRRAS